MRDSMRSALIQLVEERGYDFDFNETYKRFYRGEPPEKRNRNAQAVTAAFFKEQLPWAEFLELGSKHTSAAKELKMICQWAEILNYNPHEVRDLLFKMRENRRAANSNKQGVVKHVTNQDLEMLKKELEICCMEKSVKKRKTSSVTAGDALVKKQKKATPLSKEIIEDEDGDEEDDGGIEKDVGEDDLNNDEVLEDQPESATFDHIGKKAELRNDKRIPKAVDSLYRYTIPRPQAGPHFIQFKPWMDSAFVHGHAELGQFRLDDKSTGELRVSRLVGFWDPLQRQEPGYNLSWIIIPPMSNGALRERKWKALSHLVNQGFQSYDDVGIKFLKKDSGHVNRILQSGEAALISNVLSISLHPYDEFKVGTLLPRRPRCNLKNVLGLIAKTEDPHQDSIPALEETFLDDTIFVDSEVTNELPALVDFYRSLEERLPVPDEENVSYQQALGDIKRTLPVVYGDDQLIPVELRSRLGLAQSKGQYLPWKNDTPSALEPGPRASVALRWMVHHVGQADWLGQRALSIFGPKRCIGFAGSFRSEASAPGGALMWSVLLSGERLIVLHIAAEGSSNTVETTFKFIQHPGDLLVLPVGQKYSWYNIRTSISDEGYFYLPGGFATGHSRPSTCDEAGFDALQSFMRFLISPVFSYIAPVTCRLLEEGELVRVLKTLIWTAPMAALLLSRLTHQMHHKGSPKDWKDSFTADELDDRLYPPSESSDSDNPPPRQNVSNRDDEDPLTDLEEEEPKDDGECRVTDTDGSEEGSGVTRVEPQGLSPTQVDSQPAALAEVNPQPLAASDAESQLGAPTHMDTESPPLASTQPSMEKQKDDDTDQWGDSMGSDDLVMATLAAEAAAAENASIS
ncbi:hypothetical protein QFC22_006464 [Naganishia vaughanmartiniae]|nr:hypothetical protein QFC22_006464 [Naganishia vaughanmartiniae]